MRKLASVVLIFALVAVIVVAQRGSRGGYGGRGPRRGYYEDYRTPREITQHGHETPTWTNAPGFGKDVFTFVRVKRARAPYSYGGPWDTDTPDSDLNLSYRLQQLTSIGVDPNGLFLRLTDEELADYPFIYMVEPGSLYLTEEETVALRHYLLNGGFLMLDDFWGDSEWAGMAGQMKKVFPDRNFVELPLDHPLYRCVFDIKSKDQIPAVDIGTASETTQMTWEPFHDGDVRTVHHRAIFDDKGRLMVIATHNTDNGDGWEWEGDNHYYFEHFSEKIAYPLAINIIFYAMTH